jgi:hypothetical protein
MMTAHTLVITTTTSRTTVDGACACGWKARGTEEKVTRAFSLHLQPQPDPAGG